MTTDDLRLEVSKLSCQPGDIVVFRTDSLLPENTAVWHQVLANMRDILPAGCYFLLLPSNVSVEQLTDEQLAEAGLARVDKPVVK